MRLGIRLVVSATLASALAFALESMQDGAGPEPYECEAPRWLENFERKYGGLVFEVVLLLYIFLGLAVVIEDYFLVFLQDYVKGSSLPADVVGATFLSFANSSPEIFISVVSTAATGRVGDGLSAVIGAVVFNILMVSAVTAFMAEGSFVLSRAVVLRDMGVLLLILIAAMAIFVSGKAGLWESAFLFLMYPAYILTLLVYYSSHPGDLDSLDAESVPVTGTRTPSDRGHGSGRGQGGDSHEEQKPLIVDGPAIAEEFEAPGHKSHGSYVDVAAHVLHALNKPWDVVVGLTYPEALRKFFVFSFIMSLVWIMALSFAVLTVVKRVECGLDVNGETFGLTLIGIGVTVPNILTNGLMARDGHSDLAFSSCINSNVAGVLVGMAGPWTVLNLINKAPVKLGSEGIKIALLLLAVSYVLFFITIVVTKFRITNAHGYLWTAMYIAFLALILSGALSSRISWQEYED